MTTEGFAKSSDANQNYPPLFGVSSSTGKAAMSCWPEEFLSEGLGVLLPPDAAPTLLSLLSLCTRTDETP